MPADYKHMYTGLAGAVDDAITAIDQGLSLARIRRILQDALYRAEELFIETDDTPSEM